MPPLYLTVSTWPSTPATVVSTVALVIVVFGRFQAGGPRRAALRLGEDHQRIAFWLPSACGVAPTPMNAPGLMSASVAAGRRTPPPFGLRHPRLVALCSCLTTIVGPSTRRYCR